MKISRDEIMPIFLSLISAYLMYLAIDLWYFNPRNFRIATLTLVYGFGAISFLLIAGLRYEIIIIKQIIKEIINLRFKKQTLYNKEISELKQKIEKIEKYTPLRIALLAFFFCLLFALILFFLPQISKQF